MVRIFVFIWSISFVVNCLYEVFWMEYSILRIRGIFGVFRSKWGCLEEEFGFWVIRLFRGAGGFC